MLSTYVDRRHRRVCPSPGAADRGDDHSDPGRGRGDGVRRRRRKGCRRHTADLGTQATGLQDREDRPAARREVHRRERRTHQGHRAVRRLRDQVAAGSRAEATAGHRHQRHRPTRRAGQAGAGPRRRQVGARRTGRPDADLLAGSHRRRRQGSRRPVLRADLRPVHPQGLARAARPATAQNLGRPGRDGQGLHHQGSGRQRQGRHLRVRDPGVHQTRLHILVPRQLPLVGRRRLRSPAGPARTRLRSTARSRWRR